jgi:conjugal transfer ATP-binding protein TraC
MNKKPKITKEEAAAQAAAKKRSEEVRRAYQEGLTSLRDILAPASVVLHPNYMMLNNLFVKTLFVFTYPRYLYTNWLSPIVTFDVMMDIGMFIYPIESKSALEKLRRRSAQLQASYSTRLEKGLVREPELETAITDIEQTRELLQRGEEKIFNFSLYFTIYAKTLEDLNTIIKQLESVLGGNLIYTKQALLQVEQGFNSTLPLGNDELGIVRNMDTGSLSTTFPFSSVELTQDEGVLYGFNRHNNSLVIFDRFTLENANSVVFAKSGAGKSYAVKLEALRSLMLGTDIMVVDPENEYENLAKAVGGTIIALSLTGNQRLNPFDLPELPEEEGEDVLRTAVNNLHGLIALMIGELTPEEDALLDRALLETYALKDITGDPATHKNPPPILPDLYAVLQNMRGSESIVARLSKYVEGSFAPLFNAPTNVSLDNRFITYSLRDLEDSLRPIVMFMILNYIWLKIRKDLRRRILIIDEAWWMMQYEDSANFLYSIAKRARKYWLGLTTITQDVEDVLGTKYGKALVTNSSLQILLKQSPAAIDLVADTFNLTDGEKFLLLESDVGEGLFFAGLNHVAIKVVASYTEDRIITTRPEDVVSLAEYAASAGLTE